MVFLRTYLQLIALLLALDTLIFRSDNSSTSGYHDLFSRAYFDYCPGPITHFLYNTDHHDRHDKQTDLEHHPFTRRSLPQQFTVQALVTSLHVGKPK